MTRPALAIRDWTCPAGQCDGSGHIEVRDSREGRGLRGARCSCFSEMVAWRQAHASDDARREARQQGRNLAPACLGCPDCRQQLSTSGGQAQ